MSDDLIRVGSRVLNDLRVRFTNGMEFVIRGVSHPFSGGMAVTEGIPAGPFHEWMTEHATFDPVAAGHIFEVPADHDVTPVVMEYGHEPGLKRLLDDPDQQKLQEAGVPEEPVVNPLATYVPLPDPIPTPPAEERHTRAAPGAPPGPAPSEEKPQVISATDQAAFVPAPAADSPNQDITLNPAGAGAPSSNQAGGSPAAAPETTGAPEPLVGVKPPAA